MKAGGEGLANGGEGTGGGEGREEGTGVGRGVGKFFFFSVFILWGGEVLRFFLR